MLMFAYAGVEYENIEYVIGTEDWNRDKETLGFDFPNLPYLIDGDTKMTESWAIYRYLGRKFGLRPTTEKEEIACDMLEGVLMDTIRTFGTAAYSPDLVQKLDETRKDQLAKIKRIDQFLSGRDYIAGNKLTYVDFVLYETLDWQRLLFPDIMDETVNVKGFIKRFEGLAPIAAHISSKHYKKFPIFAPFAAWGGKDHDDRTW